MLVDAQTFQTLLKLEGLHLHGNKITEILEGLFSSLTNLRELTLRNNELSAIPEDAFWYNTKLEKLHLSSNSLYYTLPSLIFQVRITSTTHALP